MKYDIEISQIPYSSSFVSFQIRAQPQATKFVHRPIPLFDAVLKGIQSGYRHCFRTIPPDLSQYHILCEKHGFLRVKILGKQHIDEIFVDLKTCKTDCKLKYNEYSVVKGNKTKARNAAFMLPYLMLLGDFEDEQRDSMNVFNAVLFVVSHSETFK